MPLCTPCRCIEGLEVQLHLFLTSALNGGQWLTSRPALLPRKELLLYAVHILYCEIFHLRYMTTVLLMLNYKLSFHCVDSLYPDKTPNEMIVIMFDKGHSIVFLLLLPKFQAARFISQSVMATNGRQRHFLLLHG